MKNCTICGEAKPLSEFHKQASRKDGHANWCKPCKSAKKRKAYEKDRPTVLARVAVYRRENPSTCASAKRRSYEKKKDVYSAKSKAYYEANRDKLLAYSAQYRELNKEQKSGSDRRYVRARMATDPLFRLSYAVRNRIFYACRDMRVGKKSKTREMIGCDWDSLQEHLQRQFVIGMTWENYGEWHVDHIVPLASAKTEAEMIALCHYTNLQPLWAADNIRKGAKVAA